MSLLIPSNRTISLDPTSSNNHDTAVPAPIYVLPTRFSLQELHSVEDALQRCDALLTFDIQAARLILTRVTQEKRIALELREKGLHTEAVKGEATRQDDNSGDAVINVVKVAWLKDSLESGRALNLSDYMIYRGRRSGPRSVAKATVAQSSVAETQVTTTTAAADAVTSTVENSRLDSETASNGSAILERAFADAAQLSSSPSHRAHHPAKKDVVGESSSSSEEKKPPAKSRPDLIRRTTSEEEAAAHMPPAPPWVTQNLAYACQRSSPLHGPNEAFIAQLCKIRKIRDLILDEIGVRAYSTAIAAIAAYPHRLQSADEVLRLPGCEAKIGRLFTEWRRSSLDGPNGLESERFLQDARMLDEDEELHILHLFEQIWGVGAKVAREFYHLRGWRDLDDVVEFGWSSLSRVQKIGVKYYDEFKVPIPREEVAAITNVVRQHATAVRPPSHHSLHHSSSEIECIVVGGYRRGKEHSGDADMILTHPDEKVTKNLVYDVVLSLEEAGYITHTLSMHLANSNRDQQTAPVSSGEKGGRSFDKLDKALVVWQDPVTEDSDDSSPPPPELAREQQDPSAACTESSSGYTRKRKANPPSHEAQRQKKPKLGQKNPNVHRRVDIIVAPWRTVGCAVLGWTGDLTFERDLRRYAKKVKGWKFDSTGVRSRAHGGVIDLEADGATWLDREKMVLEGMGLGWRPPEERCTC